MTQTAATAAAKSHIWQRSAGLALVALAGLLYALTLDNGLRPGELLGGDLITHQYAQVEARPSNAPGYPLYTLGGWLWFHGLRSLAALFSPAPPNPLPLLSSYSTLWALLALWLLYEVAGRVTRSARRPAGNWPLAALLTAFYAVTYFFWYYATTTEQYTSAIAQTLAIVHVYLLWAERDGRGEGRGTRGDIPAIRDSQFAIRNPPSAVRETRGDRRQDWLLLLLAFLCGLSLAHMLTVAFLVPPLVAVVLWTQPSLLRRPAMILGAVAAALLPLLSYLYVYVRGAANPAWWGEGPWRDANAWFWAFVSTAQGRDELSWGFQPACTFFANDFPALIWGELSLPLLLLGLAGAALLPRRLPWVIYPTLAIYLVFDWMYRCGNWYQVILPAYPLILLGAAALFDRVEGRLADGRYPWLRWSVAIFLAAAIAWRGAASWPRADSRDRAEDTALARPALLIDQPLPANAALFAAVDDALGIDYLITIWGLRPDLHVVSSESAAATLADGRPVLATFDAAAVLLAELPADLDPARQTFSPDWLALSLAPLPPAAPAQAVALPVAEGVTLAGYTVAPSPDAAPVAQAPRGADVTLHWELAGGWPAGLGVSLRPTRGGAFLTDDTGAVIQRDGSAPGQGLAPAAGLAVDALRVPFPAGADGLKLIVYRAVDGSFENLQEINLTLPANFPGGAP